MTGKRMAVVLRVAGKPAFVAVTEVRVPGQGPARLLVMAVKFLNADARLSEISGQLLLPGLRGIGSEAVDCPEAIRIAGRSRPDPRPFRLDAEAARRAKSCAA